MSKYDASKLTKDMDGQYQVDPAVMFPKTIERIQEVLAGDPPVELIEPGWNEIPWFNPTAKAFYDEAKVITDWESPAALDLAESWFKRALVVQAGRGIAIHIIKDVKYRR